MGKYSDLAVWQRSYKVTLAIYQATRRFPIEERYGLTAQLRRAASSIVFNIAEGVSRRTDADQAHFLCMARASANEVCCELMLARDLGYLDVSTLATLYGESEQISRMLAGWLKTQARKKVRVQSVGR
jgi:four helix bundle protein